jgi:CBS domain-containing protein
MRDFDLSTFITFNPDVVRSSDSLVEVLAQWSAPEFHQWPVVDEDRRLAGLVSELDVLPVVLEMARYIADGTSLDLSLLGQRTAGQCMSSVPASTSRWDTAIHALYLLVQHHLYSLPVLDEDRLVGLVTTTDYLREFSYGDLPISREPVSDFVQDGTDPIDCEATLDEASEALTRTGVEQIGVVRGNLHVGVISARELQLARCRATFRQHLPQEFLFPGPTSVRELAADSPVIRPGARLSEAANLMAERRRQAVAVISQSGRLAGLITEETVFAAIAGTPTGIRSQGATTSRRASTG